MLLLTRDLPDLVSLTHVSEISQGFWRTYKTRTWQLAVTTKSLPLLAAISEQGESSLKENRLRQSQLIALEEQNDPLSPSR